MTQERLKDILLRLKARGALLVPALLYAAGLSLCLIKGQSLAMPPAEAVFLACAATLLLCAVLYNRYTVIAAVAAAAIFAFWQYHGMEPGEWRLFLEALKEQGNYVYAFLFQSAPYDPARDGILYLTLILSSALLSAIFVFRLRSALFASLFGLAVFIVEWSLRGEEIAYTMWIIAIACAMVFAVRGFKRASFSIWQTVALALAVSLCAWGMSSLFLPNDTNTLKSYRVERALDDVNDLISDYTGFQRPHASFSLSWFGYQPLTDRLGGPVVLPEHDVLRVNTTYPRLLRGTVRNYYTGKYWTHTVDLRTYRLGNPIIADRQEAVFGLQIPGGLDEETGFAAEYGIQVTHLVPMQSTMFTVGRVRDVLTPYDDVIPNFDEKGEVFAKRELLPGTVYTVASRLPLTESSKFAQAVRSLYRDGLVGETDQETADRNAYFFLGLYEGIPESIGKLAREITADSPNPYEKARAIQDYLTKNFTYTLTPVEPPEDADFVEYFLTTKEGYCTYFASAMAVMARTVGLPSRYVEGFLLEGSQIDQYGYVVKANQAHAWAEVYIEGIGWLSFDATPRPARPALQSAGTGGDLEEEEPEEDNSYDPIEAQEGEAAAAGFTWHFWLLGLIPLALLIAAFIVPVRLHRRRWQNDRLAQRYGEPSERISAIWRDSLRLLALLGCGIETGETPYAYANRIDEMVENPAGKLAAAAGTLVRARYGGIAPPADELAAANQYRYEMDLQYRYSAGRLRYLFVRALRKM